MNSEFCFCTLAVGKRYRSHAIQLAQDLQKYAPGIEFIVLTDRPDAFFPLANVRPIQHQLQSVEGYHDKRFAIAAAIEKYEICTFVDSDVRILGPVSKEAIDNFSAGLTARFGCNIAKHNQRISKNKPKKGSKVLSITRGISLLHNLELQQVNWLHEFMFTLRRQEGREQEFLRHWQYFSYYFELNGIYDGEGNSIGLAAAAADLTFTFRRTDWFPFFKDCIEKERLKNGFSHSEKLTRLFKEQNEIEYPNFNFFGKLNAKIAKKILIFTRKSNLRFHTLYNKKFQEWLFEVKRHGIADSAR